MSRFRKFLSLTASAAIVAASISAADARPRGSAGSRGSQTYSTPPSTSTAPTSARPIERSTTQPGQATRPTAAPAQPGARPGFFNRPGLLGGLAAGFLGAGLFGLLMGQGAFGNLGGLASFMGILLQIGLIAMVGFFLWRLWQRRSQGQSAYARSNANGRPQDNRSGLGGLAGGLGGGLAGLGGASSRAAPPQGGPASDQIGVEASDYEAFEKLLADIQTGYGRGDLGTLRTRMTPEMLSYYADEMAALNSQGLENPISDVKLLQGDLAEAWREDQTEYATVAMRYSLVDKVVERTSGRVVEGGDKPQEATEIWTFMRRVGGQWLLSAVQQTA